MLFCSSLCRAPTGTLDGSDSEWWVNGFCSVLLYAEHLQVLLMVVTVSGGSMGSVLFFSMQSTYRYS